MGQTVNTYSEVERAGVYVCTTCGDAEDTFVQGEEAGLCKNCKRPVTWEFRRPLNRRQIGFTS